MKHFTAMNSIALLKTCKFSFFLVLITFLLSKFNGLRKLTCLFNRKVESEDWEGLDFDDNFLLRREKPKQPSNQETKENEYF